MGIQHSPEFSTLVRSLLAVDKLAESLVSRLASLWIRSHTQRLQAQASTEVQLEIFRDPEVSLKFNGCTRLQTWDSRLETNQLRFLARRIVRSHFGIRRLPAQPQRAEQASLPEKQLPK
jgi:hypothetical protein